MDFNPIDDIGDALSRKKKQLVKFISGKQKKVGKNAPVRGTGDRKPKYYR